MADIKRNDSTYIANTYARFPLEIVRGKGAVAYDETGKRYLDLGAGIAVNSFGYADEVWQQAVIAQVQTLQHTSNLYYTEPCVKLAKMLCERTGMCRVFFSNSGAEANECAIKTARRYSFLKYGEGRHTIITMKNSFHGRTITTLAATGQDSFHTEFGPFTEGFVYATPGDIQELHRLTEENACAAIMIETIQGEGGVNELPAEYIAEIVKLGAEKDILVIVDEVQTGNGRTGELYSFQHYGFTPDIVSTAKGLAGGLPLGATILGEKVKDTLTPGSHGSTFGGNPMAAAAAGVVMDAMTPAFFQEVKEKGEYLRAGIAALNSPYVSGIRGMGLMIGAGIQGMTHTEMKDKLMEAGLLCLTAGNDTLRLLPPLVITKDEMDRGIAIMAEVMK